MMKAGLASSGLWVFGRLRILAMTRAPYCLIARRASKGASARLTMRLACSIFSGEEAPNFLHLSESLASTKRPGSASTRIGSFLSRPDDSAMAWSPSSRDLASLDKAE
jgi:hypothetical protein